MTSRLPAGCHPAIVPNMGAVGSSGVQPAGRKRGGNGLDERVALTGSDKSWQRYAHPNIAPLRANERRPS